MHINDVIVLENILSCFLKGLMNIERIPKKLFAKKRSKIKYLISLLPRYSVFNKRKRSWNFHVVGTKSIYWLPGRIGLVVKIIVYSNKDLVGQ